jgi:hypothetical protein
LLKRKQVKIPVHGEECRLMATDVCILFWICKGDLNKHYDGNMNPIQSYLFCIKANFKGFGGSNIVRFFNINMKYFGASFVERRSIYLLE